MVTTKRACISFCCGKINKQNHHPKCFDLSFEKKGLESESKTFVCPRGYLRNYSSNFDKKKTLTWSLDENILFLIRHIYTTMFLQNMDTA